MYCCTTKLSDCLHGHRYADRHFGTRIIILPPPRLALHGQPVRRAQLVRRHKLRNPRLTLRCYFAAINATVVSSMRFEKPHSLSYQLLTLTRRPETLVKVASKDDECES